MSKTGKQVQDDVWKMLKDSTLATLLTGKVLKEGTRERGSQNEDAIVIFTAGLPSQIETGVVTINIFVPDKDFYGNGQLMEDGERTSLLEKKAQEWVDTLTCGKSGYKFKLQQTITTDYEPEIHQHFIVVRLGYELYDGAGD